MDRLLQSYSKYIEGETEFGVCPIVLDGGKVALLRARGAGLSLLRGEAEGDPLERAASIAREYGLLVRPEEALGSRQYDENLQIGDVKFPSRREDCLCLCQLEKAESADKRILFKDIDQLGRLGIDKELIERIEQLASSKEN